MRRIGLVLAAALVLSGSALAQDDGGDQAPPAPADPLAAEVRAMGSEIYASSCATCHDNPLTHAPTRYALAGLTPEAVLRSLEGGVMQQQAAALSDVERQAVAEVVTNRTLGSSAPEVPLLRCEAGDGWFDRSQAPAFSGWGLDADGSHAIATDVAGLDRENVGQLRLKWALGFPGAINARSQPAIAGGAIFVGAGNGSVYALDLQTGCVHWEFEATTEVRTGVVVSPWQAGDDDAQLLLYFGDSLGNAYAVDAESGELAWRMRAAEHAAGTLTGTPTLHGDTLFVPVSSGEEGPAAIPTYPCCTFRGSLLALDATTGERKWQTFLVPEPQPDGENSVGVPRFGPSGVAVWSAPTVDAARGLVYIATGDNYTQPATELSDAIVALDLATGAIRWATQVTEGDAWNIGCTLPEPGPNCPEDAGPDHDFGASVILAEGDDGRSYLLAGQKSGTAYALDPDSGEVIWHTRVGRGGALGGIHFGIAAHGGNLFVPINDRGLGEIYDEPAHPGLNAIDIATGEVEWRVAADDVCEGRQFCHPGYSAAITVTPELVLAGAVDGHLRVFDSADGQLMWDQDTAIPVTTVNGTQAHGGSLGGGSAPLAYQGMLIANSGYAFLGGMPGNVLLVYGVD